MTLVMASLATTISIIGYHMMSYDIFLIVIILVGGLYRSKRIVN